MDLLQEYPHRNNQRGVWNKQKNKKQTAWWREDIKSKIEIKMKMWKCT